MVRPLSPLLIVTSSCGDTTAFSPISVCLFLRTGTEARAVGVQGRKPLHVACDHDAPAVVVQALLKVHPEASTMVGTSDMNPLHITCSSQHASVHVIRVLLEGGIPSQAEMVDVDGDTPLHAACRCGAPIEVLEVLLQANPLAVRERDLEGLTPLLRLWVRYFCLEDDDDVIQGVKGPGNLTGELGEAWRKTELLLRFDYHVVEELPRTVADLFKGRVSGKPRSHQSPFRVAHAVAAVDCPRPVVKIATIIYPHQLDEKDEAGLTPLMIAASAPTFKVRDLSDNGYSLEDRIYGDIADSDEKNQDDDDSAGQQPSVIEILLQASADAACVPNPEGRLPLHLALASGKLWNQGVKELIACYPDALGVVDCKTGLTPFQLAAEGPVPDLSTIFEVIRASPLLTLEDEDAMDTAEEFVLMYHI